jgi:hypothetical protein
MSATLEEKQPVEMDESFVQSIPATGGSSATEDAPIDLRAERRLLLKLDLVIWPVFFVIYMMSFLDRINISNAKIQGMAEDLDLLKGTRFNVALFVSLSGTRNAERTKRLTLD